MSPRFAIVVAVLGLACSTPRQTPPPDPAVVRAEIDSLWKKYSAAAVAGDGEGIASLYSEDAYVVESGLGTINGKAALRSTVKEVLGAVRFLDSSIRPEMTEIAGDRVLQFGTYRDVLQETGKPAQKVEGRFAAVLVRDSTSAWRVTRLIAVADSTVPVRGNPK